MPVFWNYQFATHYPPESSPELVNLAFGNVKDITSCSRMNILTTRKTILALVLLTGIAGIIVYSTIEENVDFNAEIKPILNKKCISCHGGVRRQGDFSVLFRSEALGKTKSGHYGIVPGRPDQSEMIRRIKLKDPEERMPYQHQPLSTKEISLLTRWVKQGAQWGNHWAYVPVLPVEVPKPPRRFFGLLASGRWDWPRSDLDRFIYQKLQQVELQPGKEADKATLLRRVSLDLIGLPAPDSIAQKFLNKKGNEGYEELVDNLLASPRFGEKWTAMWLDLARYADTKGYERDDNRSVWRYRDWLIRAFNEDKPYDVFLTEQIAGDLLPEATDEQLIATAFHRNTMTNDEGGTDNEEFRVAAVMDRVNTTWQALMGTTFSCVQCHSHPYDPFTHDEYYRFMAFFNNTRDEDTFSDYPLLRHFTGQDSNRLVHLKKWLDQNGYSTEAKEAYQFIKTWQPAVNSIQTDSFTNCELGDTKWLVMRSPSSARLKNVDLNGKNKLIFRFSGYVDHGTWTIHLDRKDGKVLKKLDIPKTKGWKILEADFPQTGGTHDLFFTYVNPDLKSPDQTGIQFDWFYFTKALPGQDRNGFSIIKKDFTDLLSKEVATTPIIQENPVHLNRTTRVFERGNWLTKGKSVSAGVPHALIAFPENAPANRLGLAKWLTDERNPLTARTMVNRLWEQLFGSGIVETLEDMGTQGAEPTYKELLDYLSYKFMNEYKWSLKKLLKEMVLSATYRQDSKLTKEGLEKDPSNKYYGRGSRVRLSAEQIRDQALALSGALSEKMYGPGVMPWQPEGIWMSPWNGAYWQKSEGEDQYRRAVYTFWKRTSAYPSMITFDGIGREVCISRRIRTNTPLQALVTLNDSVYVEASRLLAYRLTREAGLRDIRMQISKVYEQAFFRPISGTKLNALQGLYYKALIKFRDDPRGTCLMVGENAEYNNPETAALVVVMNAFLNMDEMITKS